MKEGRDNLAKAIAALPYRSPRRGFSARVMAAIAEGRPARAYGLAEAAELMVAGWTAVVAWFFAGWLRANWADAAAFLIQPGAFSQALHLAAARGAMLAGKFIAFARLAAEAGALAAGRPAVYELAAAVLLSAAAVYALGGRPAAQRI